MTSASSRRLVGVGVPTTSRSFAKSIIPSLRRHDRRTRDHPTGSVGTEAARPPGPRVDVARVGRVPPGREAAVPDDLGARLGAEPPSPAEVVRVAVRDDHGVHPSQGRPGVGQSSGQRRPRLGPRKTRIDEGQAAPVLERVAVHVAEPRHRDGSWSRRTQDRPRSPRSSPAPAPDAARRSEPWGQDNCCYNFSLPAGGRPARNLSHRARLDGSRDDGTGSRS